MKKKGRYFLLALFCILCMGMPAYGAKNKDLEGELKDAKNEQDSLKNGKKSAEKTLNSLETKKDNLEEYIKEIDKDLNAREKSLNSLSGQLSTKEQQIADTQAQLDAAMEQETLQYAAMKERIRYTYENGNNTYLEMLFQAGDFSDFINRAEFVSKVYEYDKNMLISYQETKNTIANAKAQLEEDKKAIEGLKADAEYEKKQLQQVADAKEKQMESYESDIEDVEKKIKEYEKEIKAQDAAIKELEAQVKRQKEAAAKANAGAGAAATKYDGGMFTWPCPSSTRITSPFGSRKDPKLGIVKQHNGIDIGAAYGSNIIAAYDGTVVAAGYHSSMGNYVMIDHGSNLYTIYMHASSLLVSSGAKVTKGQRIALVGSTGYSTGNHLHFGVRLNGSYVSPWNYLKQ